MDDGQTTGRKTNGVLGWREWASTSTARDAVMKRKVARGKRHARGSAGARVFHTCGRGKRRGGAEFRFGDIRVRTSIVGDENLPYQSRPSARKHVVFKLDIRLRCEGGHCDNDTVQGEHTTTAKMVFGRAMVERGQVVASGGDAPSRARVLCVQERQTRRACV